MMKLLTSLLVLGLISFIVPSFAEPDVADDGSVMTMILLTPEFEVDTSEFDTTGEIIIDVKFENTGSNGFHGLKWVWEEFDHENDIAPDPAEFYEKYERNRMFYIQIDDVTNEKTRLDPNQFIISTNNQFIQINGKHEDYDRFVIEVLDIDELVQWSPTGKGKIETTLRLSFPELLENHDYEIDVWAISSAPADKITFTLPPMQEIDTPEPVPLEIIEPVKEIPKWVKGIFEFYADGSIGDEELIGALQYLIKEGIIKV